MEYYRDNEYEYLAVSEIPGRDCFEEIKYNTKENIVIEVALELKKIHSIQIGDCPFDQRLNEKLRQAKYRVDNHLGMKQILIKQDLV